MWWPAKGAIPHVPTLKGFTRFWCNGSTADSKPVGQGSNPWGRALKFGVWSLRCAYRFFLQIDVKIAMSSLVSAVSGSRREEATISGLANKQCSRSPTQNRAARFARKTERFDQVNHVSWHQCKATHFKLPPSNFQSPVVQRRRHLFYTQETMVRFHPGLLRAYPKTRSGSRGGFRPSPETAEILDEFRYDTSRSFMIEWVSG